MNFWCRKSLGKLEHVPTGNKTDSFSIFKLFYVKIKFLNGKRKGSEERSDQVLVQNRPLQAVNEP